MGTVTVTVPILPPSRKSASGRCSLGGADLVDRLAQRRRDPRLLLGAEVVAGFEAAQHMLELLDSLRGGKLIVGAQDDPRALPAVRTRLGNLVLRAFALG